MRRLILVLGRVLALGLALAACVAPAPPTTQTTAILSAADAATSLLAGDRITVTRIAPAADASAQDDPLIRLTLTHADGRVMSFQEANHAPHQVMAQAPGGPLAQVMGLFGEERPVLYSVQADQNSGAPFLCGSDSLVGIGYYAAPDGSVQIVGLKQEFAFETRPDGVEAPLPYSPDQVCARLRFRNG